MELTKNELIQLQDAVRKALKQKHEDHLLMEDDYSKRELETTANAYYKISCKLELEVVAIETVCKYGLEHLISDLRGEPNSMVI